MAHLWTSLGIVGGTIAGCIATAVAATSIGLNIWNLVVCKKGLEITQSSCPHTLQLQAFFIGSIVCSALSLLTCGITVPVPQLVFAILGQAWRHMACGPSTTVSWSMHISIIVLWFTFAANLLLLFALCCLPYCLVAAFSEDEPNRRPSYRV